MVEHDDITILFTDIEMPGPMNGLALAHHARSQSTARKIIITSGRHQVDPSELPSESIFLPKPYRMGLVIETLKKLAA
jgi:CheY-like chemotaxis protein